MRILITNDDGIHSVGLNYLTEIAKTISDDVWVVAPEIDQSGASHSLSVHNPLRMCKLSDKRFAVSGTPTDCVILGVFEVLSDKKPDLILSGINRGMNVADDVTYSGTVAGAMEGASLGIASIALSQTYSFCPGEVVNWDVSKEYGKRVIEKLISFNKLKNEAVFFNVNFPSCSSSEVKGIKYTKQGRFNQTALNFEKRVDPHGIEYYWLVYNRDKGEKREGYDLSAIDDNFISISPLHLDMTSMESYNSILQEL